VTLAVDTYPGRELTGTVDAIMAGTGSVFSLFPTENASGTYVKVVQRIPVKIVFDKGNGVLPPLRLGMSGSSTPGRRPGHTRLPIAGW